MDSILSIFKGADSIENCLCRAVEEAAEGIAIINLDGTIRYANTALATMHGYYTAEELTGKGLELLHNEEQMRADVAPLMEEVKRRGQIAGPVEHIRSGGTIFPTETRMVAITDSKGRCSGLAVFVTDMSERGSVEQSLMGENVKLTKANEQLQAQTSELTQGQASMAERISVLRAVNEKLEREIRQCQRSIEELNQYRDWLEQQMEQQTVRLTAADEQLKQRVAECARAEEKLRDCYSKLEQQATERRQFEETIEQLRAELSTVRGQVQPSDGAEKGVVLEWDAWDKQVKAVSEENADTLKSGTKPRRKRKKLHSADEPLNTKQLKELSDIGKRVSLKTKSS